MPLRAVIALVILTLFAGALGGWAGVVYGERTTHQPVNLHTLVHRDLDLTAAQNQQIAALERRFTAHHKIFEAEMRAANRDLAVALDADHTFGPKEQAAVNRFHRAEEGLQEATIRHVLAMRAVLNAKQDQKFDRAIYDALTAGSS